MGPMTVVVLFPGCGLGAGVGQGREQHLVQKLVPKAAVEAFDEAVLHGFSRCNVVPGNVGALRPRQDRRRGELRPIITDDGAWAPS